MTDLPAPAPLLIPGIETDQDVIFCEEMARHGDAALAVVRSGIRMAAYSVEIVAQRTLARPEIARAVDLLREAVRGRPQVEITRESIIADLQQVYEKALHESDYGNAISAKKLQSALFGLLIQKTEHTSKIAVGYMTDEQLYEIAGQKQLGLPAPHGDVIDVEAEEVN